MVEKNRALFILKPDALNKFDVIGVRADQKARMLIATSGLKVTKEATAHLDEQKIRQMYPVLNRPDLKYGESWKPKLIEHLISAPLVALDLRGNDANQVANEIKKQLRKIYSPDQSQHSIVVANIAHVPDPDEYWTTRDIFFQRLKR